LTRTPEFIVDLRLRMQEMEAEKEDIVRNNEALRDQNNDLTTVVVDQDRRIDALTTQIEQLTNLVQSMLGEGPKQPDEDYDPFT